jgi:hypothetical protein
MMCGFGRTSDGELGQPVCRPSCQTTDLSPLAGAFKPTQIVLAPWTPSAANLSELVTSAGSTAIFRMSAAQNSIQSAASTTLPISFAISPVADSDVTEGPFKAFADKLLSPLINVRPDGEVSFGTDASTGVSLEFPLLDAALQGNSTTAVTLCAKVLAKSKVVSYSDALVAANVRTAMRESTICVQGSPIGSYTCVCKAIVRHFTTFGVAQTEAAAATDAAGLGVGPIIGIVIGALFVVMIVVFVGLAYAKRKKHSARNRGHRSNPHDIHL